MTDALLQVLLSAAGGILGAWLTYLIWVRQQIREIRRAYDQELRTARMTAYLALWREFQPLAVYSPERDVTYADVARLGAAIRKWYFNKGGLLFTARARDIYFLVQDAIDRVAQSGHIGVIRGATTYWTRDDLDDARQRLDIAPMPEAHVSKERETWRSATSTRIRQWRFGSAPDEDFVLLQFLASSLRTILADDIRARDPSILDEM